MAVLSLIPISTTAATSFTINLLAGQSIPLYLNYNPADASGITRVSATVERKTSDGVWIPVGSIGGNNREYLLQSEGDYQVVKPSSSVPFGIDHAVKPE